MRRAIVYIISEAFIVTGILLALIKGISIEEILTGILGILVLCLLPLYKTHREGEKRI